MVESKGLHRSEWALGGAGVLSVLAGMMLLVACPARCSAADRKPGADSAKDARVRVFFGRDCEAALIHEIERAKKDIQVAIYSFTRRNISRALVEAVERGVKVELKYDAKSYEWKGMQAAIGYMRKRGVICQAVKLEGEYAKMHHKFTVIDGVRVVTGSFNYSTTAARDNYENLVVIENRKVARLFKEEFEGIKGE